MPWTPSWGFELTAESSINQQSITLFSDSEFGWSTGSGATKTGVGVVRGSRPEDRHEYLDWWADGADVVLPVQTATDLFFAVPANRETGLNRTLVEADSPDDVKDVAQAIKEMGLRAESLVEMIEREQFTYLLMFGVMTCVAAVALVVAALGIINTMLISVLERTREIGIMKAIGARNGHILGVFLVEGAWIGLVGGLLGLLAGWTVAQPGWKGRYSSGQSGLWWALRCLPAW